MDASAHHVGRGQASHFGPGARAETGDPKGQSGFGGRVFEERAASPSPGYGLRGAL